MLTEVCHFIHNYFVRENWAGTFKIEGGTIDGLDAMVKNGQRFRIIGSALNDGIYTKTADGIYSDDATDAVTLQDEEFSGALVAMGVPADVLALVQDIKAWVEKNADTLDGPYTSESFGGYSYTKATGANGGILGWQDVFKSRLNAYRKIS